MSLSSVVDVAVTIESARVASAGFGVPLVIAHTKTVDQVGERVIIVEDADELVSAYGFTSTDPEYLAVARIFSQDPAPNRVAIGFRDAGAPSTMKHTITPAGADDGETYAFVVNSSDLTDAASLIDYEAEAADTEEDVVDAWIVALGALFPGLTATKVGVGAAAVLEVTGPWRSILTADPDLVEVLQNHATGGAIATDLAAMAEASDEWYCVISLVPSKAEALAIAAWVEANGKLFVVDTQDADVPTSGATDFATALAAYDRTVPIFDFWNGNFTAAALAGKCLSFDPGSATWKFKTLSGVTANLPRKLTTSERTYVEGKNCNVYRTIGGRDVTGEGVVASGEFVDVIHFRDWLVARIGERVFSRLASAKKIPFTDAGVAVLEAEVKAQLSEGVNVGGLAADPAPTTTVPKVASVSSVDKAARYLRTIEFAATLAGAVHKTRIRGTVSV